MPRLYVLAGRNAGRSFEVEADSVLGRGPECDVQVVDRSVSRRHARVGRDAHGWFVEDLESRNGVKRNGERVRRASLADHDEIVLGELPLRFRLEEQGAAADARTEPPREAPPRATAATRRSAPDPGQVELEEEIDLEALAATRVSEPAVAAEEPAPESSRSAPIRPKRTKTGVLGGDLGQLPFWLRAVLTLVALGIGAGFVYGAFRFVTSLRG